MIHSKQHDHAVSLVAFDLLQLNGDDVRADSLLDRKARLARLVAKVKDGIEYNDHLTGAGADISLAPAVWAMRASSPSGSTCRTSPAGQSVG